MTDTPADQSADGPSDGDLHHLVDQLAKPAALLLNNLATAAVAVLRGMLDEAYERGRTEERASRRSGGPLKPGQTRIVINESSGPPPGGGPSPAAMAMLVERNRRMRA